MKRLPDSTAVDLLDLSVGTANCLQKCGVKTIGEARRLTFAEWISKLAPHRGGEGDRKNLFKDLWHHGVRLRPVVEQTAWAIESLHPRTSSIHCATVRRTRSEAWKAALHVLTGGLTPEHKAYPMWLAMFKRRRRLKLIRAVRVQIEWEARR